MQRDESEKQYYRAIKNNENHAAIYQEIYEQSFNLENYPGWYRYYSSLMAYILDLKANTNFLLKPILTIGSDEVIERLHKLNILFLEYYKIHKSLHIDREIIAKQIQVICDELKEFFFIKNNEKLLNNVQEISKTINSMLALHHEKININNNDNDFCFLTMCEIDKVFHDADSATQSAILNSETLKKNPQIFKNLMLMIVRDGHGKQINSIAILKNNGFDINAQMKESRYNQYDNLLAYAVYEKNEIAALKLIELGATITDQSVSYSIKCSIDFMKIMLDKRPECYQPCIEDYTSLVDEAHIRCKVYVDKEKQAKEKLELLCDRCLPDSKILGHALEKGNFPIALMLMEKYSLKFPERMNFENIILENKIKNLYKVKLNIPVNILSYDFYKQLSAEKIQYCIDRGAATTQIRLDSPGVMGVPDVCAKLIENQKELHKMEFKDDYDQTMGLLHYAALHGHPETVRLLLRKGFDVNIATTDGRTPMHYAAAYNNPETIKVLIEEGANVNAVDKTGQTPLHKAAETDSALSARNIPSAKLLLHAGASKRLKDVFNKTAYQSVYRAGYYHAEEIHAWDNAFETQPNPVWNFNEVRKNALIFAQAKRQKMDVDSECHISFLPTDILCAIATLLGHHRNIIEIDMNYFIIASACFNSRPGEDLSSSIIIYALGHPSSFPVTSRLLQQYSILISKELENKQMLDLQDIIQDCSIDELKRLNLPIPVDFLSQTNTLRTYEKIYQLLSAEKIQYCIDNGASIENIDLDSDGVLGLPLLVERLFDKNKITPDTAEGINIFFNAAQYGHPDTLRFFIGMKFDVNGRDVDQNTALHCAAKCNNPEMIRILIDEGADVNAVNKFNEDPLRMAAKSSALDNAKILLYAARMQQSARDLGNTLFYVNAYRESPDYLSYHKKIGEVFKIRFNPDRQLKFYEVRKNSRVLANALRNGTSFFSLLPKEICYSISAMSGENRNKMGSDTKSYEIAKNSFCKL